MGELARSNRHAVMPSPSSNSIETLLACNPLVRLRLLISSSCSRRSQIGSNVACFAFRTRSPRTPTRPVQQPRDQGRGGWLNKNNPMFSFFHTPAHLLSPLNRAAFLLMYCPCPNPRPLHGEPSQTEVDVGNTVLFRVEETRGARPLRQQGNWFPFSAFSLRMRA